MSDIQYQHPDALEDKKMEDPYQQKCMPTETTGCSTFLLQVCYEAETEDPALLPR